MPVQATPTFNPSGGDYAATQSVTITSAGADAIYFTTDGSTPTAGSTLYIGAISVAVPTTIRAIAVKALYTNSAVASANFVINSASGGEGSGTSTVITSDFGTRITSPRTALIPTRGTRII